MGKELPPFIADHAAGFGRHRLPDNIRARLSHDPRSDAWADILHWCIRVMDADDEDLGFTASLLGYCLNYGGLTDRQAKYATKIQQRVVDMYDAMELECWNAQDG